MTGDLLGELEQVAPREEDTLALRDMASRHGNGAARRSRSRGTPARGGVSPSF